MPTKPLPKLNLERLMLLYCSRFEETIKTDIESPHIFGSNVYALCHGNYAR